MHFMIIMHMSPYDTYDEAAVGVMCRLEHSQKEIVLQSIHGPVFILQSTMGRVVQ